MSEQLSSEQSNCAHVMVGRVCQKCGTVAGPVSGTYEPPSEQSYSGTVAPNMLMAVTLNKCGECEGVASDEAWQKAWWNERSRRIGQVNRGEVDAVDEGWVTGSRFTSSYGLDDRMVCPRCGYVHSDDECSYVEELEGLAVELPKGRRS